MFHNDVEACVDAILAQVGKKVVLGLPLGLGKANHIANALYRRAESDRSIHLSIFTALTLEKHLQGPALLHRFIDPIIERLFGDYPDLLYAQAVRAGNLPANIDVAEFYLLAGQWLHVTATQHGYISANYSEAPRLLLSRGVNVIAQLVAKRETADGREYSLSGNTDVTLDLPKGQDTSLGIAFDDPPGRHYRATLFVNGWQMGNYIAELGPQRRFPIPNGVIDPQGPNNITIAVWKTDDAPGGLGAVSLIDYGSYTSSRASPRP